MKHHYLVTLKDLDGKFLAQFTLATNATRTGTVYQDAVDVARRKGYSVDNIDIQAAR